MEGYDVITDSEKEMLRTIIDQKLDADFLVLLLRIRLKK